MKLLQEMINLTQQYMLSEAFERMEECERHLMQLMELMNNSPSAYKPQTDDINKAIDWLLAARRGIGILSKKDTIISPEDKAKHLSRFFANLNRIRALVDRLIKTHDQQHPNAEHSMIKLHQQMVQ